MFILIDKFLVDMNNFDKVFKIFSKLSSTDENADERTDKAIKELKAINENIYADYLKDGDVPGLLW